MGSFQAVLESLRTEGVTDVILLLPAWNEPILDVTRFLRSARKAMGSNGRLWLELFGLRGENELPPLNASDRRNWELALQEWADDGLIPRTLPDAQTEEES